MTYTASSLDILAVLGEVNCPERLSSRLCEMVEDWCELSWFCWWEVGVEWKLVENIRAEAAWRGRCWFVQAAE
jgi:hypothetical protein